MEYRTEEYWPHKFGARVAATTTTLSDIFPGLAFVSRNGIKVLKRPGERSLVPFRPVLPPWILLFSILREIRIAYYIRNANVKTALSCHERENYFITSSET